MGQRTTPKSPSDLEKLTGLPNKYIRNTLPKLIRRGLVKKMDRGKYVFIGDIEDIEDIGDNEDNEDNMLLSECPRTSQTEDIQDDILYPMISIN